MKAFITVLLLTVASSALAGMARSTNYYECDYLIVTDGGGHSSSSTYDLVVALDSGSTGGSSSSSTYSIESVVGSSIEKNASAEDWQLYN